MPPPDAAPVPVPPVPLTVNIVSSFGTGAFVPNPIQAVAGDTVVWMNNDLLPHTIILADGTIVGNLAPGQSSLPIALTSPTVSYQCTIHPSMVGQVVAAGTLPLPPDQMPAPSPGPVQPDPYGDGYDDGYGDGYDDYGYLRSEL
jgi:plastocyanin